MKKVLLSGYYGFDNAGDELVLREILSNIYKENPDAAVTVLSAQPKKTSHEFSVRSVNRWNPLTLLKEIISHNMIISGGGSLLQDATSRNGILYYLGIIFAGILTGKSVYVFSQGVGPVTHRRNRILTRVLLNRTEGIFVRDEESLSFLKELGITKEIQLAADPVFLLPTVSLEKQQKIRDQLGLDKEKKIITVALRNWANQNQVLEQVGKFLENFSREEWEVVFLPMHYPEDMLAMAAVEDSGTMIRERLSLDDTIGLLASSSLVLGMRLHALIISASQGVPFISVSYDPKVDSLDRSIYPGTLSLTTENVNAERLQEKYRQILNAPYTVAEHTKRARMPFAIFRNQK